MESPVYLDANATTALDPRVLACMGELWSSSPGNASATHGPGRYAAHLVDCAQEELLEATGGTWRRVIWTSGATEANNTVVAHLGGRSRHLVVSALEHASVLRPVEHLLRRGLLEVSWVGCGADGVVSVEAVLAALRPDTGGVLLMAANNVTGALQPVEALADALPPRLWLHVDAAQALGKGVALGHPRIDSLSLSAHKLHGPVGVGALLLRQGREVEALLRGGEQQEGLRAGTVAVPLVVGMARAAALAHAEQVARRRAYLETRRALLGFLAQEGAQLLTPLQRSLPNTLCVRFPGLEGGLVQAAWSPWATVGLGSACQAGHAAPSHVLLAMGLRPREALEVVRLSWGFGAPALPLRRMGQALSKIQRGAA